MAKLQVLIAMTLNGFVPARNDSLLQWIQNSDDGFPYWRGRSTRMLYPGYPLVDLICDKEQSAPSDIYLAEIYDDSGAELLRGLSLYRLIDEMVIFLLPVISSETVPVSKHISTDKWGTGQDKKHSETGSAALLIAKHCNKRLHALAFAIPQSAPIFRG